MINGLLKIVLIIVINVSIFGLEKFVCMLKSILYNVEIDLNIILF